MTGVIVALLAVEWLLLAAVFDFAVQEKRDMEDIRQEIDALRQLVQTFVQAVPEIQTAVTGITTDYQTLKARIEAGEPVGERHVRALQTLMEGAGTAR